MGENLDIESLRDSEVEDLLARYPHLVRVAPGRIEGVFELYAQFDDLVLEDSFEISISISDRTSYLPLLREVGGRTEAIAKKWKIADTRALHRNADGAACLCARRDERRKCPEGYTLLQYVERLVVPYLYGLSYFDEHGRWPWGELSHGALGLLEFYGRGGRVSNQTELDEVLRVLQSDANGPALARQIRNPSAKRKCPCNSGKQMGKCHRDAWLGIKRMHAYIATSPLRRAKHGS